MTWERGPLPSGTFGEGAVITAACKKPGFHFADFCGDHAELVADGNDNARIVPADKVEWFCLIPPEPRIASDGKRGRRSRAARDTSRPERRHRREC